jgi:eukaryotic-like serine/threonine-protein kinase
MNADETAAREEEFASWMAACEDALAAGNAGPAPAAPGPLREQQPRLQENLACAQLLRQVLGDVTPLVPGARDGSAGARSEAGPSARSPDLPWANLGRFQLRRELGRGGFGMVFLAYDPLLGREVALKVPHAEMALTPELRERFHREARAASGLDHPNLVPVHEVGEVGPVRFIVSAYCPGVTLAAWLKQRTEPVPWHEAATLLAPLAEAVHHAHQRGVVHRDLKPANVLLTADGTPRITDFGLAKHVPVGPAGDEPTLTRSGTFLGTAAYVAPEQADGKLREVGPAADVYALGVILYELLTGRPPFRGETDLDTLLQVRTEEPIPPTRLRLRVPRDLETICLKCLQKKTAQRYPTALALAEDLRRFLAGKPILARPVGRAGRLLRWCRRKPALAAASGLAATALTALVALAASFTLYQARANERLSGAAASLRQEQEKTRAALEEVKKQYALAERRSALLALESGLAQCERGEVCGGMFWLAQSLEIAAKPGPAGAADLEWLARVNLAHWRHEFVPLRAMLPHPKGSRAVAFSPDGRSILTGSWEGTVQLWHAATGKPLGPPLQFQGEITSVAFSSDGRLFVTGGAGKTAQVWEAATGRLLGPPLPHPHSVHAVAFSPDGRTVLTGCQDGSARFWDTTTGQLVGSPLQHDDAVVAVAFSPDGRTVLTGSGDKTARFWEAATGKPVGLPLEHDAMVESVAYSPDGRTVLTGSDDKTARFWEAGTGRPIGAPLPHPQGVLAVAFSPDGRMVLTGSGDRTARLWDATTGRLLGRPLRHPNCVNAVTFSPDGRNILTAGWSQPARLWEIALGQPLVPPLQHPDEVQAAAYSPNGRTVLTGCKDGTGRFWDAATGKFLNPTLHHQARILAVAYSPDGRTVLTGSVDKTARLWEAATGKPVGLPLTHENQVNAVAFSPDGRTVLTGCKDGTGRFWEAATGKPLLLPPLQHQSSVEAVAYSPDGRIVVTCDYPARAYFWEVATGNLLGPTLPLSNCGFGGFGGFDVAFSPDGRTILTGGRDMTARLWDVATRQPLGRSLQHQASVKSVAFSPDGRTVLTGSYDGTAQLWAAASGTLLGPPLRHKGEVSVVAFSPDGRTVLTGGYDHTARFWPVPAPVAGEPERIRLWIEVLTGMELDPGGVAQSLDAPTWLERRRRLDEMGGPPMP